MGSSHSDGTVIPDNYQLEEQPNGNWRITSPTGWWVSFRTREDAEELFGMMRYYLDKPKPQ